MVPRAVALVVAAAVEAAVATVAVAAGAVVAGAAVALATPTTLDAPAAPALRPRLGPLRVAVAGRPAPTAVTRTG